MTAGIEVIGLVTNTTIGIHPWEQKILQKLVLDITIPLDISRCNNHLSNTLDYDALCQSVTEFVESNTFTLIETVANQVLELIKNRFSLPSVTVRVCKPHAIKNASNICVSVTHALL